MTKMAEERGDIRNAAGKMIMVQSSFENVWNKIDFYKVEVFFKTI